MWNIAFENGRQVWEYLREGVYPNGEEPKDGRPTRTAEGISYNGLPLMTDGVVHTHMLEKENTTRTPLGKRGVTFDPKHCKSTYDKPTPISRKDVEGVVSESHYLSNPNTGDDVYRRQNIPREIFRPGSSTNTSTVGANNGVNTVRSVYKKNAGKIHDWNYAYVQARRKDKNAALPVDYFAEKFSPEGLEKHRTSPEITEYPEEAVIDTTFTTEKEFLRTVEQSGIDGAEFFKHVQGKDGHIPSDYGGPMFLMPGLIIVCYVTGTHLPEQTKLQIIKYVCSHQQKDGGWGLHIESKSTMFGTVLNYIGLRLLGCDADLKPVQKAREWIRKHGGAIGIPSWGKFWLGVLNILPWDGMNSIFPEMWLLPQFLPIFPGRFWCHCRMVYLPMAYIYGAKFEFPVNDLIINLRKELYVEEYSKIDFTQFRDFVASTDKYTEQALLLKVANFGMNVYEKMPFKPFFRKRAMNFILDYVSAEDEQTNFVDIGPVSKFINMLCCFHGYGKESMQFRLHQSRIVDYLWIAEDGIKCQGYNGSQLWDTSFLVQAMTELEKGICTYNNKFTDNIRKLDEQYTTSPLRPFYENAYRFIEDTQIRDETVDREKYFRHVSLGGWPFSTRDHGWPISDCTAEGLKAAIALHKTGVLTIPTKIDPVCGRVRYVDQARMEDAVNVMLTLQNYNGGWATYENTRGPAWLEMFNPSEVFGGIMVDYSYVECTSACVQALHKVREYLKNPSSVDEAIQHGIEFIQEVQRPDGGWVGSWGVCFTYGAWFGMEGLRCAGFTYQNNEAVRKGCDFLLRYQNKDGGWGESFQSCVTKEYCHSYNKSLIKSGEDEDAASEPVSMVINTAWSIMALLEADYHLVDRSVLDKAIQFIMSRQLPNGDWPQEGISGVFNGNCMITYTAYRSIFPIWAIGRYLSSVVQSLK